MNSSLKGKTILITGGTGSFGKKFSETVLKTQLLKKLIIFSRDEFKQHMMAKVLPNSKTKVRFFIGDVRDRDRLERAFEGVDYVVHAAALKQVPALEYNPTEAVKTNILGASNIVEAALNNKVKKVIALSTDKAVNPINLYGATKLVAEKIFIDANAYGGNRVKFAVARYGNVMASRGSVIEYFLKLQRARVRDFPITDTRMTRFWMTLEQSVHLVEKALSVMEGGEIFVPRIPSMKIVDLAKAINPNCRFDIVGIRPGEKMHETLVSEDEARKAKEFDGLYVILPQFAEKQSVHKKYKPYRCVSDGFSYRSDTNKDWMSIPQLKKIVNKVKV